MRQPYVDDLDAALTEAFPQRIGSNGAAMRVAVSRLNLANRTSSAFGRDQSALQGNVQIVTPGGRRLGIDVRTGQAAESRVVAILSTAPATPAASTPS